MRQTTRIDTKATNRYKIGKQNYIVIYVGSFLKLRHDFCHRADQVFVRSVLQQVALRQRWYVWRCLLMTIAVNHRFFFFVGLFNALIGEGKGF